MEAAGMVVDDAAEDPVLAEVITAVAQAEVARAAAERNPFADGPTIRIPVLGGDDELYVQHPTRGRLKILRHGVDF